MPTPLLTSRRTRLGLLPMLVALGLLLALVPGIAARSDRAAAATTQVLPFALPSTSALRASPKKVFAHWVPSLPVSIDNLPADRDYYTVDWLDPNGEGGRHSDIGGFLRDRPLPRAVRPESNWKLLDMEAEVRQATSEGIDGFSTVLYTLAGDGGSLFSNNVLMMQAAAAADPGFKIIIQPDLSSSIKTKTAEVLAASVAQLAAYSSAYRLSDGRLVVSPFDAESHDAAWWKHFLDVMKSTYGITVAFLPLFLDERPQVSSFAPISYGLSNWGNRTPAWNDPNATTPTSAKGRIATVHNAGLKWMAPVSVQDERPRDSQFLEADNTDNLRDTWQIAIQNNAEIVQMNTWNDLPEGSQMEPSQQNGWTYLDISAYYLTWFKTGKAPTINQDTVYLTHRIQPYQAKPSYPQTKLMTLPKTASGSPARDTVEALTFLTAPGTVTITDGGVSTSCNVPAGPATCLAPLKPGTVSAKVTRGGATTASLTSPYTVKATPYVQDLHYVGASSGRQGTSSVAPAPAPSPTPTPTPTATLPPNSPAGSTVAVVAAADATGDSATPATNAGTSAFLLSRGTQAATSYLRFVLPAAPAGKTLTGAALQLRTTTDASAGSESTHQVRTGSNSWAESTLTWDNHPTVTGTALGSTPANVAASTSFSVALNVAAVKALLGTTSSFTLSGTTSDGLYLFSREAAAPYRPTLVLTFS